MTKSSTPNTRFGRLATPEAMCGSKRYYIINYAFPQGIISLDEPDPRLSFLSTYMEPLERERVLLTFLARDDDQAAIFKKEWEEFHTSKGVPLKPRQRRSWEPLG